MDRGAERADPRGPRRGARTGPVSVAAARAPRRRAPRWPRPGGEPGRDAVGLGDGLAKGGILSMDADAKGRWVVLAAHEGWTRNDLYLLSREAGSDGNRPRVVIEGADGLSQAVVAGGRLWI